MQQHLKAPGKKMNFGKFTNNTKHPILKLEKSNKKIDRQNLPILFNQTCLRELLLPKNTLFKCVCVYWHAHMYDVLLHLIADNYIYVHLEIHFKQILIIWYKSEICKIYIMFMGVIMIIIIYGFYFVWAVLAFQYYKRWSTQKALLAELRNE